MLTTILGAEWLVLDFPFPCEIHYRVPHRIEISDRYKVLFTHTEPLAFCLSREQLAAIHDHFDLIISCHPEHLDFPNAVFEVYGGLWVKTMPQSKSFTASFMYSQGLTNISVDGYDQRTGFMEKAGQSRMALRSFRSRRVPAGVADDLPLLKDDRKDQLFQSMFHVCFENSQAMNYFTEKLCDCFATYTVPIYWGCPNIGDFFNMDGIIVARSHEHAIALLNDLTPADYWQRLDAMRDNFRRSRKYWDWVGRLRSVILREHARMMDRPAHTEIPA